MNVFRQMRSKITHLSKTNKKGLKVLHLVFGGVTFSVWRCVGYLFSINVN